VENEKEQSHGKGAERIDERWEQGDRGYDPVSNAQYGANQMEGQNRRYEDGADQREQCRTLEIHARIMNDASGAVQGGAAHLTLCQAGLSGL